MQNRINIKSLIIQTILYKILALLSTICVIWVFTGSFGSGIGYGLGIHFVTTIIYFLYHYVFLKKVNVIKKDKGFTLWFTGLPCSGKTTIADYVGSELIEKGIKVVRLDGDIVRKSLTKDLGFSKEDRGKNLERVTFVAKLLSEHGVGALCTFVSPYREVRDKIRKETTNFIEVFVYASSETCAKRDVKGMWAKAKAGEIKGFTGWDDPYEQPGAPEIWLDTEKEAVEKSVEKVILYLKGKKLI